MVDVVRWYRIVQEQRRKARQDHNDLLLWTLLLMSTNLIPQSLAHDPILPAEAEPLPEEDLFQLLEETLLDPQPPGQKPPASGGGNNGTGEEPKEEGFRDGTFTDGAGLPQRQSFFLELYMDFPPFTNSGAPPLKFGTPGNIKLLRDLFGDDPFQDLAQPTTDIPGLILAIDAVLPAIGMALAQTQGGSTSPPINLFDALGTSIDDPQTKALQQALQDLLGGAPNIMFFGTFSKITIDAMGNITSDPLPGSTSLPEGDRGTDTFMIPLTFPDGTMQTFTTMVSTTGINDAPDITGNDNPIPIPPGGGDTMGKFNINDPDTGENFFQARGPGDPFQGLYGTLTIDENGNWVYNLDPDNPNYQSLRAGEMSTDAFTLLTADGTPVLLILSVTGINDAPEPADSALSNLSEGAGPVLFDVATDGEDPDNDPLTLESIDQVRVDGMSVPNTFVTIVGNQLQIDPSVFISLRQGEMADIEIDYTLRDPSGATGSATASTQIIGVNNGHTVAPATITAPSIFEDGGGQGNFFFGAVTDADTNDVHTYEIASQTPEGMVINNGDGTFSFDVGSDFQDLDVGATRDVMFTYLARDQNGNPSDNIATGTIRVTGTNDVPIATIPIGDRFVDAVTGDANIDVSGNFVDIDVGDTLMYSAHLMGGADLSTIGLAIDPITGVITGTPPAAAIGTTFVIEVFAEDNNAGLSLPQTFQLTINPPSSNISAVFGGDDMGVVSEDGVLIFNGILTVMDPNPGEDMFVASMITTPFGTFSLLVDGNWTYTLNNPSLNVQGLSQGDLISETFDVQSLDGTIKTSPGVSITVNGSNDSHSVNSADETGTSLMEDGNLQGLFSFPAVNDVDQNDIYTYEIVSQTSEGLVVNNNNGTYSFNVGNDFQDLSLGATRDVSFTYRALDQFGNSSTNIETITLKVTGTNDSPVVSSPLINRVGEELMPFMEDISGNFSDIDSDDTLTYTATLIGGTPLPSWLMFDTNTGIFSGTPAGGDADILQIEVTATDSNGASSPPDTFQLTINMAGNVPADITGDNSGLVIEDIMLQASGNLEIDDLNGPAQEMFVPQIVITANGRFELLDTDGNWIYDINNPAVQNLSGDDAPIVESFPIQSVDGTMKDISITVRGVNDVHLVLDDSITGPVEDGGSLMFTFPAVADPDATDSHDYDVFTPPTEGIVTNNFDGTFNFDPGSDFQDLQEGEQRIISFTYRATDQNGVPSSNMGTIMIAVTGTNDDPSITMALVDRFADEGDMFTYDTSSNFDDVDTGNILTYSAQLMGGGDISTVGLSIDPGTGIITGITVLGTHIIEVYADDGGGGTPAMSTFTLQVNPIGTNSEPTIGGDDVAAVAEDGLLNEMGALTISDPDGAAQEIFVPQVIMSMFGTFSILANGEWTYVLENGAPAVQGLSAGETPMDIFTVLSVDGTMTDIMVTILGEDDPSMVSDLSILNNAMGALPQEDGPVAGPFMLPPVDDIDNMDIHTYQIVTNSTEGIATITDASTGAFTFNTESDFQDLGAGDFRDVSFTYRGLNQDMVASTNVGTVTIRVTGQNDDPFLVVNLVDRFTEDDDLFTYDVSPHFADPDNGDVLSYSADVEGPLSLADLNLMINSSTGIISKLNASLIPVGTYTIEVTVNDGIGTPLTRGFELSVVDALINPNQSATITPLDLGAIGEDEAVPASGMLMIDDDDGSAQEMFVPTTIMTANGLFKVLDAAGNWTYDVDNASVQSLSDGESLIEMLQVQSVDGTLQTVMLTINGADDVHAVLDDSISGPVEDGSAFMFAFPAVTDPDATDVHGYEILNQPSEGMVSNNFDGTYNFEPGSDFQDLALGETRDVTFSYQAFNQDLIPSSNIGVITVTVAGTNDDPSLDTPLANRVAVVNMAFTQMVDGNFSDVDASDTLFFTALLENDDPLPSWLTFSNGEFTGTPEPGDVGTFNVKVIADDSRGGTASDVFQIQVKSMNSPAMITGTLSGTIMEDDILVDSGTLSITDPDTGEDAFVPGLMITPNGVFTIDGAGVWTYTLNNAAVQSLGASDSVVEMFTIQSIDGTMETVEITALGKNDAPIEASVGDATRSEDDLMIDMGPLLGLVLDVDASDTHSISNIALMGGEPATTFVYTPGTGILAIDEIQFQSLQIGESTTRTFVAAVSDGAGGTVDTSFKVTILGSNDVPLSALVTDSTIGEDYASIQISTDNFPMGILGAVVDPDDTVHSITNIVLKAGQPAISFSFNPLTKLLEIDPGQFESLAQGETGVVTFVATVSDPLGASVEEEFDVDVIGANDPPVANPDMFAPIAQDAPLTNLDVLMNDTDVDDGDMLSIVSIDEVRVDGMVVTNTFVTIVGNQLQLDPSGFSDLTAIESAAIEIDYTIQDLQEATSSSTASITVTGLNDPPLANPDMFAPITEDDPLTDLDVLMNDTDTDTGDMLSIASIDEVRVNGMVVTNTFVNIVSNQLQIDPSAFNGLAAGETADVEIDHTIQDLVGAMSSTTASITVEGKNDDPMVDMAIDNQRSIETISFDFMIPPDTFSDPDETDVLTLTAELQGGDPLSSIGLMMDSSGQFSGTPNLSGQMDPLMSDTFTIEVTAEDGNGGTVTTFFDIFIRNKFEFDFMDPDPMGSQRDLTGFNPAMDQIKVLNVPDSDETPGLSPNDLGLNLNFTTIPDGGAVERYRLELTDPMGGFVGAAAFFDIPVANPTTFKFELNGSLAVDVLLATDQDDNGSFFTKVVGDGLSIEDDSPPNDDITMVSNSTISQLIYGLTGNDVISGDVGDKTLTIEGTNAGIQNGLGQTFTRTYSNKTQNYADDFINAGPGDDKAVGDLCSFTYRLIGGNSDSRPQSGTPFDLSARSTQNVQDIAYNFGNDLILGDSGLNTLVGDVDIFNWDIKGGTALAEGLAIRVEQLGGLIVIEDANAITTLNVRSHTFTFGDDTFKGGSDDNTIIGDVRDFDISLGFEPLTGGEATLAQGERLPFSLSGAKATAQSTVNFENNTLKFGNDEVEGGSSNDHIIGDIQDFTFTLSGGDTTAETDSLSFSLSANSTATIHATNNTFITGADTIGGKEGDDVIIGDIENLIIDLSAGSESEMGQNTVASSTYTFTNNTLTLRSDTITGGGGNDNLYGDYRSFMVMENGMAAADPVQRLRELGNTVNFGRDIFVFDLSVDTGTDTIHDMNVGEVKDILRFSNVPGANPGDAFKDLKAITDLVDNSGKLRLKIYTDENKNALRGVVDFPNVDFEDHFLNLLTQGGDQVDVILLSAFEFDYLALGNESRILTSFDATIDQLKLFNLLDVTGDGQRTFKDLGLSVDFVIESGQYKMTITNKLTGDFTNVLFPNVPIADPTEIMINVDTNEDYIADTPFTFLLGDDEINTLVGTLTGTELVYGLGESDTLIGDVNGSSVPNGTVFSDDFLVGGGGGDFLFGDTPRLFLPGSGGTATFGDDTLLGGPGDDRLFGDVQRGYRFASNHIFGNDWIKGGEGNDQIWGDFWRMASNNTPGADTIVYDLLIDNGTDTINNFNNATSGVYDKLLIQNAPGSTIHDLGSIFTMPNFLQAELLDSMGDPVGIINFSALSAGARKAVFRVALDTEMDGQDAEYTVIDGTNSNNQNNNTALVGTRDGSELIFGHGGNDFLYGSSNSTIEAMTVSESQTALIQPDYLVGGTGGDTIFGDAPTLTGMIASGDTILGEAGNDTIYGDAQIFNFTTFTINTEEVASLIVAPPRGGNNTIDGGSGNDTIYGNAETINSAPIAGGTLARAGSDDIKGGDGNDTIFGDARTTNFGTIMGQDTIEGGRGNDTLVGDVLTVTLISDLVPAPTYARDIFVYDLADSSPNALGNDVIRDINAGGVRDFLKFQDVASFTDLLDRTEFDPNGDGSGNGLLVVYSDPSKTDVVGMVSFEGLNPVGLEMVDQGTAPDGGILVAINGRPIAQNDGANININTATDIDVLDNDFDPDGDSLSIASFDAMGANGGSITDQGDGILRYTPPMGFSGVDVFQYTATDDFSPSSAFITVTVGIDPFTYDVNNPDPLNSERQFPGINVTSLPATITVQNVDASGTPDICDLFNLFTLSTRPDPNGNDRIQFTLDSMSTFVGAGYLPGVDVGTAFGQRLNITLNGTLFSLDLGRNIGDTLVLTTDAAYSFGGNDTLIGDVNDINVSPSVSAAPSGGSNIFNGTESADYANNLLVDQGGNSRLIGDVRLILWNFNANGSVFNFNSGTSTRDAAIRNNTLNFGKDVLVGGDGNDILIGDLQELTWSMNNGGSGTLRIAGGAGVPPVLTLNLLAENNALNFGNDRLFGDAGADNLVGDLQTMKWFLGPISPSGPNLVHFVESLGSGDITVLHAIQNNTFTFGNDTLEGGPGNDILIGDIDMMEFVQRPPKADGGTDFGRAAHITQVSGNTFAYGNDGLEGGEDNDTLVGDIGTFEWKVEAGIAEAADGFLGGGATFAQSEARADNNTFNFGADTLNGDQGEDTLIGDMETFNLTISEGSATVNDISFNKNGDGSAFAQPYVRNNAFNLGNDILRGGEGDDTLIGDIDSFSVTQNSGSTSGTTSTATAVVSDNTVNMGQDILEGGAGDDMLTGDIVTLGGDLTGFTITYAQDTFVFDFSEVGGLGTDTIKDWDAGRIGDRLLFENVASFADLMAQSEFDLLGDGFGNAKLDLYSDSNKTTQIGSIIFEGSGVNQVLTDQGVSSAGILASIAPIEITLDRNLSLAENGDHIIGLSGGPLPIVNMGNDSDATAVSALQYDIVDVNGADRYKITLLDANGMAIGSRTIIDLDVTPTSTEIILEIDDINNGTPLSRTLQLYDNSAQTGGGDGEDILNGEMVTSSSHLLHTFEGVNVFAGDYLNVIISPDLGNSPSIFEGADDVLTLSGSENSQLFGDVQELTHTRNLLTVQSTSSFGDDLLIGNDGNNLIVGDAEILTIFGPIGINSAASATIAMGMDTLFGNGGDDTLYGDGKMLTYQANSNFFVGALSNGQDRLDGGAGDDTLIGDTETITLTGNGTSIVTYAQDTFVFDLAEMGGFGEDTIKDLNAGMISDILEFSNVLDVTAGDSVDDLLALSRVVDDGNGDAKVEVYNVDISGGLMGGETLLGSVTLEGVGFSGTELDDYMDVNFTAN